MVDEKTSEELEREAMSDAGIEAIMKIYRDAQEVMDQIVPYELAMKPIQYCIASDRSG
ncbi:MAG: hypothetical protein GXX95_01140 [Methanomassiliicoccus sp.]|nr:hypothetical protein [Methanomassiliicoccus sp.]